MGFFDKIKAGLTKTRNAMASTLGNVFNFSQIDDDFYDELEESLILGFLDHIHSTSLSLVQINIHTLHGRDFFIEESSCQRGKVAGDVAGIELIAACPLRGEGIGGGKGALILEDPENPLTCGIEIRVQPPGKQVKTITLLSGGEKAFVAIALYFAILKVRPTPFCMLDEIDAALDDRNVERFAKYLHNLSKKTQFIVITHRRGTMEASDVLYGVTMQEQGVSKLLRLDLNQMEQQLGIVE